MCCVSVRLEHLINYSLHTKFSPEARVTNSSTSSVLYSLAQVDFSCPKIAQCWAEIVIIDTGKLKPHSTMTTNTKSERPACNFFSKAIRMINDLQKVLSVAFITFSMFSRRFFLFFDSHRTSSMTRGVPKTSCTLSTQKVGTRDKWTLLVGCVSFHYFARRRQPEKEQARQSAWKTLNFHARIK